MQAFGQVYMSYIDIQMYWGQLILWLKEAGINFLCSWMGPFQGQMELLKRKGFRDLLNTFLLYCGNYHLRNVPCQGPSEIHQFTLWRNFSLLICHFLVMIITLSLLVSSPQCLKCFQIWHLWSSVPSAPMFMYFHWAVCSFLTGMQWLLANGFLLRAFEMLPFSLDIFLLFWGIFAQFFLMLIVNWKWTQPQQGRFHLMTLLLWLKAEADLNSKVLTE